MPPNQPACAVFAGFGNKANEAVRKAVYEQVKASMTGSF